MNFLRIETESQFWKWQALDGIVNAESKGRPVPPLRQELRRHFHRSLHEDASIALYAVCDENGRFLGRTTVHHDPEMDAKLGERVQLFGYTEFIDDPAVSGCLFDGIMSEAECAGRTRILGPANLLPNAFGGVILSGFEKDGFFDSAHNPDYYPAHYENAGFEPTYRSETLICNFTDQTPHPRDVLRFDDNRLSAEGLEVRYCDKRHIKEQIEMLRILLNRCFADRPYYTPITKDEMQERMAGLGHVMDRQLLAYLTCNNEPVGFAVFVIVLARFRLRIILRRIEQ